ncbi:MAG: hypothetical protein WBR18_08445 [Anaerolineales bacterium]
MNGTFAFLRRGGVARWIARVWTLLLAGFALRMTFTPDPMITEPVPLQDYFLLSLWGLAIVGLLAAWRWERAGAWITLGVMFFREIAWVVLKGGWMVSFLIVWALMAPPAALYLLAASKEPTGADQPPTSGAAA